MTFTLTEILSLVTAVLAVLTAIASWLHQGRALKQKESELKHTFETDSKKLDIELKKLEMEVNKLKSSEEHLKDWLEVLPEPPSAPADVDHANAWLPYQAGYPIRNMDLFYGRQPQVESVLQCINGPQMSSIFIRGVRRSGKTSFLYHIQNLLNPDRYPQVVPVFLDAQSAVSGDRGFYAYMLREASAALNARSISGSRPLEVGKDVDFMLLAKFLDDARQKQWRFVFLLDEFERLVGDSDFSGEDFFASLRSLTSRGKITWVAASFREVYMPGTLTSPFINIIQETAWVGPLSEPDAWLLVKEPAARASHPFEREDIDLILQLAGRMPFLLQKAALTLYKLHLAGVDGLPARQHLAEDFQAEIRAHFKSQLDLFLDDEKEILFQLVRQGKTGENDQVLKQLERYGLVEMTASGYKIMGQAFENYLREMAKQQG
jgi:hypothetical protein